jgi:predicted FMN-binding regulatory protein PaiB
MSQNRDVQDRDGVAKGLGRRGGGDDLEMAEIVSRHITASG